MTSVSFVIPKEQKCIENKIFDMKIYGQNYIHVNAVMMCVPSHPMVITVKLYTL